jgi:hypothetical protein
VKKLIALIAVSTICTIVWILLAKATAQMQSVAGSLAVRMLPIVWLCTGLYLVLRHKRQPS